jgi:hypothetical protein
MQLPAFDTPLSALDNHAQQMGHVWIGEKPGQGPKVIGPWVHPCLYILSLLAGKPRFITYGRTNW